MSTIETERLVPRPFRESDATDVLNHTPGCDAAPAEKQYRIDNATPQPMQEGGLTT